MHPTILRMYLKFSRVCDSFGSNGADKFSRRQAKSFMNGLKNYKLFYTSS